VLHLFLDHTNVGHKNDRLASRPGCKARSKLKNKTTDFHADELSGRSRNASSHSREKEREREFCKR